MYLAGLSVRRVEDITEALWGTRVSPSTVSLCAISPEMKGHFHRSPPLILSFGLMFIGNPVAALRSPSSKSSSIMTTIDPDLGKMVGAELARNGVRIITNQAISSIAVDDIDCASRATLQRVGGRAFMLCFLCYGGAQKNQFENFGVPLGRLSSHRRAKAFGFVLQPP
jgi:hypothetical protein